MSEQTDYWSWAGRIWQKSWELNTRLWKEAAQGFQDQAASGAKAVPVASAVPEGSNAVLRAYQDYVQLSLKYAEDVVNLGLRASREANRVFPDAGSSPSPARGADFRPYEIKLAGRAGETVQTSFSLSSSEAGRRTCKLRAGEFICEDSGAASKLTCRFNPEEFALAPGESRTVELSVAVPKNQAKGPYRGKITVQGFEDAEFVVLLEVAAKAAPKAAKKAATKRASKGESAQ